MRGIADTIFEPIISVLQGGLDALSHVQMVAARGLNLDYFLGPFAGLGSAWIMLIKSFIGAFVLVGVVLAVKGIYSLYLQLKSGVKWW